MAEQEKRSESLAAGARASVWIGAIVCAGIFWCGGMVMGAKWEARGNQAWYDVTVRPVAQEQAGLIRDLAGQLKGCREEVLAFQKSTGFSSGAQRDSFIVRLTGAPGDSAYATAGAR